MLNCDLIQRCIAFWLLSAALCFAQGATPQIASVVNSASLLGGPISPDELVTITGANFASSFNGFQLANGLLPTSLGGCQVMFDEIPAPLTSVAATQIETTVPSATAGRFASQLAVQCNGQSASFSLPVSTTSIGLYTEDGSGMGQAAAFNSDDFGNLSINSPATPANRGSRVFVYATGGGSVVPNIPEGVIVNGGNELSLPVSATVGGVTAQLNYAGWMPTLLSGIVAFEIIIPSDAPTGNAVPIVVANALVPGDGSGSSTSQQGVTLCIE